jgi:NitT/TauT family transport system substrate-binding protein
MHRLSRVLFAFVCLAISGAAEAADLQKVTFVLDFIPLGRHAPWYVALDKGYFRQEGLDVNILPSKGTADAIRTVVSGAAEFGFIDVPSLVAAGSAARGLKIVAVNYQLPPYCVMSLASGGNITEPKQMVGLQFGSSTASFLPAIWRAFMNMNHLDGSKLDVVNIDAAARVPMLVSHKVAAVDQFVMGIPGISKAAPDDQVRCLFAGDFGLDIYSNSIGVMDTYLAAHPDQVKGFVRAALKGWHDALLDPEMAAAAQVKYVKALDPGIIAEEVKVLKRVALTSDVQQNGLGAMSLAKMENSVKFINDNVEVSGEKLTAKDIFAPGYLPEPPVKP